MASSPCMTCGARAKIPGRHRCIVCMDRTLPIGDRVANARRRLQMVPEELRVARVPKGEWPAGTRWCASCQSFVDLEDTSGSRCKPCASAATHAKAVEKTYGITGDDYAALLARQAGTCAICRRGFKSKRGAVDHEHGVEGAESVRGILCSRHNHELLGSANDDPAILWTAYVYLMSPPARTPGDWDAFLAKHPAPALTPPPAEFGRPSGKAAPPPPPVVSAARVPLPKWHRSMSTEDSARYWEYMARAAENDPSPF